MASERRTTSIRQSLSRNMLVMIALLSAAILLSTIYTANSIRISASRNLIERVMSRVESELTGFFTPIQRILRLSRRWAESGLIDPSDNASLNALFMPVLDQAPHISSFNIGDDQGRGVLLLRLEDRWRNRRVNAQGWGDRLEFQEWSDEDTLIREWDVDEPKEDERYDPRTRAWYQVALEDAERMEPDAELPERVYWTEPYAFFSTGEPGISAAVHARAPDGERFVLALDVSLTEISNFTRQIEISPYGLLGIVDEERRMIGLPSDPSFDDSTNSSRALLKRADELGIPAIADGAAAFLELGANPPDIFSFESGAEIYWAQFRPFALGINRSFIIFVAIPEDDLLGIVQRQRLLFGAIALIAMIGAGLMAMALSRRFSHPLGELVRKSQRMGQLDLAPSAAIESSLTEVDQLAAEQERMRIALDAFSKYVPVELVRELLRRGEAAKIGGSERDITILFTDVIGFTTIAEAMTPTELTLHLAEYFAALLELIQEDGFGDINEIAGDGVVAFWGAPADDDDHAFHAVDAILRSRDRLAELNLDWRQRGLPAMPTRFGLATGPVVVGNVGAPSRLSYAAVGDTVNTASRIEGLNRIYGTEALVTAAVRERAGRGYRWRLVDVVRVKGKYDALEIYELLGRTSEITPEVERFVQRYEEAFGLFRDRRFEDSIRLLEDLARERADDLSIQRLLARARAMRDDPPGAGWVAVSHFEVK
jgi:adenylate cyclase